METSGIIFSIIVLLLAVDYFFDRILDLLNSRMLTGDLPGELAGIFDEEKYKKSKEYSKVKLRFSAFTSTFSFILIMLMLFFDGFALLDRFCREITENPIFIALIFFGVLGFISDLLSIPFSAYATFVIEEKFGFNKTSVITFILDKLKSWLLAIILGGGLLSLIIWLFVITGPWFWLVAWATLTIVMVFMSAFYSNLIVPLFNKQSPLEEGELRTAVETFSKKTGFRLNNIYVIDGSKRSRKANAYFTGFGPKKRIVLFDTLIKDHSTDELVAILAHEIGHYRLKHTITGLIISLLETGLMLFVMSLFISSADLAAALGVDESSFHIGIIVFGVLYSPVSLILGLASNIMSRRNEFAADRFAAENHNAASLQDALKKLSVNNLSNLLPHPLYVFFHYSHPTLQKRLAALEKTRKTEKEKRGKEILNDLSI